MIEFRVDDLSSAATQALVLTLDLDGFTQVNDQLGHHGGDALLITVAQALEQHRPADAVIARIGGDEFAMLSPGDLTEGRALGERLRSAIGQALLSTGSASGSGIGGTRSGAAGRMIAATPKKFL